MIRKETVVDGTDAIRRCQKMESSPKGLVHLHHNIERNDMQTFINM